MSGDDRSSDSKRVPSYVPSRSTSLDLVDMAALIQQADHVLQAVTHNKLRVIADQIRLLQQQAREVLEEARDASDLHRVECRFRKRSGHIYHLYRRPEGTTYFSMLSPQDWRGVPPDPFVGSYRLEADMSFTPLDNIDHRDSQNEVLNRLFAAAWDSVHESEDG